jgi:DNA topoisomerase IA
LGIHRDALVQKDRLEESMMNLLIVASDVVYNKAMETFNIKEWRVAQPSLFSKKWNVHGNDVEDEIIKQHMNKFDAIYLEDNSKFEYLTLLQHAINTLHVKEYYLCDFESVDDVQDAVKNGYLVDEKHALSKKAEHVINMMFAHRFSNGIKTAIIEERIKKYKETFSNANSCEISTATKRWHKQIQNFYVILPTIASLHWIIKAERTIDAYEPKKLYKVYASYLKDGIEFSLPLSTTYTDDHIQERNDAVEYLRNPANEHKVSFYQTEERSIKPTYRPITLSFLQSKMFYLYHFGIEYTTILAKRLHHAGLITNPMTNSKQIPYQASAALIRYLNIKYGDDYVLQTQRDYKDADTDGCAIIPIYFEEAYDKDHVINTKEFESIPFDNVKMKNDALVLYSFIYMITEWIQLKDAIYNTSILQVEAGGNKKLEARSNFLSEVYDSEKGENVPQKCWRIINTSLLNALDTTEDTPLEGSFVTVLPKCSYEERLSPINIDFTTISAKRPPRYGVGRFNTQILGGKGIGTAESFHIIQSNLVNANLVSLANNMMHPQEIAKELVEWCEKYAPMLLDEKNIVEYWDRLNRIRFDNDEPERLIGEYSFLIDEIFDEASIKETALSVTDAQVKLAKAIIIQKNIKIDNIDVFLSDAANVKKILETYSKQDEQDEQNRLFKCPICRQGYVYEKEYVNTENGEISPYYSCEHPDCFRIFDGKIDDFFVGKKINFNKKERFEAIQNIASKQHLKNNGYMFFGFTGKNEKNYDAKVVISPYKNNNGKTSYGLQLKF